MNAFHTRKVRLFPCNSDCERLIATFSASRKVTFNPR